MNRWIGPYEITATLGSSAIGTVYRAHDSSLGRDVALRVLAPELLGDDTAIARFRRDAAVAARLSHPGIAKVYGIGQADGLLYMARELLEGRSLRELLVAGGPLACEEAVRLAREVVDALAHAHERDIVHRDVRVENVWRLVDGSFKLTGFGFSRAHGELRSRAGLDVAASALAPEVIWGQEVDARSDLFALGALLYETLSGKAPFAAASAAGSIERALAKRPRPIAALRETPWSWLDDLIQSLLEKDPAERPQSARDVASLLRAGLRSVVAGGPASAPSAAGAAGAPGGADAADDTDATDRADVTDAAESGDPAEPGTEAAPSVVLRSDPASAPPAPPTPPGNREDEARPGSRPVKSPPPGPAHRGRPRLTPRAVAPQSAASGGRGVSPAVAWAAGVVVAVIAAGALRHARADSTDVIRAARSALDAGEPERAAALLVPLVGAAPSEPSIVEPVVATVHALALAASEESLPRRLGSAGTLLEPYLRRAREGGPVELAPASVVPAIDDLAVRTFSLALDGDAAPALLSRTAALVEARRALETGNARTGGLEPDAVCGRLDRIGGPSGDARGRWDHDAAVDRLARACGVPPPPRIAAARGRPTPSAPPVQPAVTPEPWPGTPVPIAVPPARELWTEPPPATPRGEPRSPRPAATPAPVVAERQPLATPAAPGWPRASGGETGTPPPAASAVEARSQVTPAPEPGRFSRVCALALAHRYTEAAGVLETLDADRIGEGAGYALASAVFFNASYVAVKAGRCRDGLRLARLAADYDDPAAEPSNRSWLRTLELIGRCDDFNLQTTAHVAGDKPIPPEACPLPPPAAAPRAR